MSEALNFGRILQLTGADSQSSSCTIRLSIRNQNHAQLVFESNDPVLPRIRIRLPQLFVFQENHFDGQNETKCHAMNLLGKTAV